MGGRYIEEWIEAKLRERLKLYQKKYPAFKVDRFMEDVENWPDKAQRWSPYMGDVDIKSHNVRARKGRSIARQAAGEK